MQVTRTASYHEHAINPNILRLRRGSAPPRKHHHLDTRDVVRGEPLPPDGVLLPRERGSRGRVYEPRCGIPHRGDQVHGGEGLERGEGQDGGDVRVEAGAVRRAAEKEDGICHSQHARAGKELEYGLLCCLRCVEGRVVHEDVYDRGHTGE